jgi:hypothetical protein
MIAVVCLAACSIDPSDRTVGSQGAIDFSYHPHYGTPVGDDCFISCGIDRPLLAGATEGISVASHTGGPLPWLHAASSDPSVLALATRELTCCNYGCTEGDHYDECLANGYEPSYSLGIDVTGVSEGSAHLVLYSDMDPLYDELPISVHRAVSLELQAQINAAHNDYDFQAVNELDLAGKHISLRVIARDGAGDRLFATSGIAVSVGGEVTAFNGKTPNIDAAYGELWPMKRGTDTIVATSGDVTITVPVVSN